MTLKEACFSALTLLPIVALADGDFATESLPRAVPYHGLLELDGLAVTADVAMRFTLYDAQGAPAWVEERSDDPATKSCAADACLVPVVGGRFTAWLGLHQPILDTLLDGAPRDLEIAVREEGGAWRTLAPRQTITPVARAMWTLEADTLAVEGALTIEGAARVSGAVEVAGGINISEDIGVEGAVEAGSVTALADSTARSISAGGLSVGGDLIIEDARVDFAAGAQGAGGPALTVERSNSGANTLSLGIRSGQGALLSDGRIFLEEWLISRGGVTARDGLSFPKWRLVDERHMFRAEYFNLGGNQNINTGLRGEEWMCWVGGVRFTGGDICEYHTAACSDSGETEIEAIMSVFAYPDRFANHEWHIHAEFLSHIDDEEAEVLLVCVQVDAVGVRCADGRGYWMVDCPNTDPYLDLQPRLDLYPDAWRW